MSSVETTPLSPQSAVDSYLHTDDPIEVDTDLGGEPDYESTYGTNGTQSVTSSVRNYVYENGRRYHRLGEGKYTVPNDEAEQNRLDMYHHLCLLLLGGDLISAPIEAPHRVLDCGTGTGIWALDFAETHEMSEVIGVDLSPIQPTWVYPNVKFEVDDLDKDWTWPEDHFDLIHSRLICPGIHNWKTYVGQMFRHCKPGGWVEFHEWKHSVDCNDDTYEGSRMQEYWNLYAEANKKAGFLLPSDRDIMDYLEQAGFVDISVKYISCPWGTWPKKKDLKLMGATATACLETGLEAYALALLTRFTGMNDEAVKMLCNDVLDEVISRKVHASQLGYSITGRKPESA